MTITRGRGGWTRFGMPDNDHDGVGDTRNYDFRTPEFVGQSRAGSLGNWTGHAPAEWSQHGFDAFAVNRGVRAIQARIKDMGFAPSLPVDGILDLRTDYAIGWAQGRLGVRVDGQAGPVTCLAMFWPAVQVAAHGSDVIAHAVGGIAAHESAWDPGAVGFGTPDDLGLVQINGPANPTLTADERFDYRTAFSYAVGRIRDALDSGYTLRQAICSYGYPAVAQFWHQSGTETYPSSPTLNDTAVKYVNFIVSWVPPS